MAQMIINGEQFVAKKLVDTGNGRGHVPLPEAVRFLSADLVRLKRMEYFAKAFFTRGVQEGAELTCTVFLLTLFIRLWWSVDFQISGGFLIKVYTNEPCLEPEEQPADLADFVGVSTLVSVYLVEPRRASSAVLKFSGALGLPYRSDPRSATIMAFSHFVLEAAACKYMFADIQGKSTINCVTPHHWCKCRINGSTRICAEWVCLNTLWSNDSYAAWVS